MPENFGQKYAISKILSRNDTGQSGSHQGGILIPKLPNILMLFPVLDEHILNPRKAVPFIDVRGFEWEFIFIYYNNSLFGGTRNEFRLTHMTDFFRKFDLVFGDVIIFSMDDGGTRFVDSRKSMESHGIAGSITINGKKWKIITTKQGGQNAQ